MKKNSNLFMFFGVVSITAMIISNITAFKMVQIGPLVLPAAVFLFPFTYIIGDVVVEVYGIKKAQTLVWWSFGMNLAAVLYFAFAIWLPSPVWFEGGGAFAEVLSGTPRILTAGLIAFLTGSFLNIKIMDVMKTRDGERRFALRAVLSTVFGEGIDAIIFITIAFVGTMPLEALAVMIASQAGFKIAYEILILPVTSRVVAFAREKELMQ